MDSKEYQQVFHKIADCLVGLDANEACACLCTILIVCCKYKKITKEEFISLISKSWDELDETDKP